VNAENQDNLSQESSSDSTNNANNVIEASSPPTMGSIPKKDPLFKDLTLD
jgi:hypothetical protein